MAESGSMESSLSDLIPGLPDEVAMLCLARLPFGHHPLLSCVCRSWRRALELPLLFDIRARLGFEEHFLFIMMPAEVSLFSCPPSCFYLIDSRLAKCYPCLRGISFSYGIRRNLLALGRQVLIWIDPETHPWHDPYPDVPWCFDLASRLRFRPPPPIKWRTGFASATVDGYVYAAGESGSHDSKSAERFDLASKKWERISNMTEERRWASGVAWKGSFCVLGGWHTNPQGNYIELDSAEVWDALKEEWQLIPGIWPIGVCMVATVKGKLYALKCSHVKEVMLLDEKRNHWIPHGSVTYDLQGLALYELIGVGDELCMLVQRADRKCILLATDPESLPLCWRLLPFCLDTFPSNVCVVTL